jgi:hypothetical protein
VANFGLPTDVSSDRGTEFTNQLWKDLSNLLGFNLHHTTSYHPQANGAVERFNQTMKAAIMAHEDDPAWTDHLPWALLGMRISYKADLDTSAAELVYGQPLTVPGEFVTDFFHQPVPVVLQQLRERVGDLRPVPHARHGVQVERVPAALGKSSHVFIRVDKHRKPLQKPYEGPFKVIEHGSKTVKVQRGTKVEDITVNRLKPAFVDELVEIPVAQPPR